MTPATIVREAQADGVVLTLTPSGSIKAIGDGAAVDRWLRTIREHKTGIIEALNQSSIDSRTLHHHEEKLINSWLASIGETDIVTIAEVVDFCRRDPRAKSYFVGRANGSKG